jgi:hypothetical protein
VANYVSTQSHTHTHSPRTLYLRLSLYSSISSPISLSLTFFCIFCPQEILIVYILLFVFCSHVTGTYQDGVLVYVCPVRFTPFFSRSHEARPASLINTDNCDPTCRNLTLQVCNCAQVTKTDSGGKTASHIEVPASYLDVFYDLPVKIMCPFEKATELDNTIYILGEKSKLPYLRVGGDC